MTAEADKPIENGSRVAGGIGAALVAALVASACCTIPFLLVTFGVGGVWVSSFAAFEPLRPIFLVLAAGGVLFAVISEIRAIHRKRSAAPDCACESRSSLLRRRTSLVIGIAAVTLLAFSPDLLPGGQTDTIAQSSVDEKNHKSTRLEITGMTCSSCAATLRKGLLSTPGILAAKVTYSPPEAWVKFDSELITVDGIVDRTRAIGYPGRVID